LRDNARAYLAQKETPAKAAEFKKALGRLKMKEGRKTAFVIHLLFIVYFFFRVFVGC
jgi:hypothetical protein